MSDAEPVRTVEVIEVIRVVALAGKGTQDAPFREVASYWTRDGVLLATNDPAKEAQET